MSSFEVTGLPADEVDAVLAGAHPDPFRILGPHQVGDDLAVRVFRPDAKEMSIVLAGKGEQRFPGERLRREGFFQAVLPGMNREVDLHLFSEGTHLQVYEKFGAHLRTVGGVKGVYFAVWAPNAQRVSVVGDFNGWDGRTNPMRRLLGTGVWELFLPDVGEGVHYKFEIRTPAGALLLKSDPFALFNQHGLQTSSMVYDLERYKWRDGEWMEARPKRPMQTSALSIYEVHLG